MLPFVIEFVAALIGLIPVFVLPGSQAIAAALFGWLLLPLVILDHRNLWLPNRLVMPLAIIGFLLGPVMTPTISVLERFAGLVVGFLSLEIVRQAYKQFRQQDGMGAGDPKLFGALGVWLGWQALPITLLIASFIGILKAAVTLRASKRTISVLPLGCFLGISAFLVSLAG